jgi:hypothetical protein
LAARANEVAGAVDGSRGCAGPQLAVGALVRSWVVLVVLVVGSCAGRHDGDTVDFGSADLAEPLSDIGPFACALPLDRYCAQNDCVADLTTATAEARSRCADPSRPTIASTVSCRDDVIVNLTETDAGSDWVYDRASGQLAAVLYHANTQAGCSGGPTELDLIGCDDGSLLCPAGL